MQIDESSEFRTDRAHVVAAFPNPKAKDPQPPPLHLSYLPITTHSNQPQCPHLCEGFYGLFYGYQHRNLNAFSVSSIPSLTGKTALVTGSNSGIGKWTALRLAQRGAKVYLACRSKAKAEAAMKWIREEGQCKDAELQFFEYDAAVLGSVYRNAMAFVEAHEKLDILVLNAGTIGDEAKGSQDGVEWLFAVNHLAHFALTMGLMPAVRKACMEGDGDVRVVMTTSAGFSMHPDKGDLHIEDHEVLMADDGQGNNWWKGAMPMYGQSKTCIVLFAKELSRRLRKMDWGKGVRVNSCHPGTVSTSLNDTLRSGSWFFLIIESLIYALVSIPRDVSALALLYAATSDDVRDRDITGQYMTPYGYVNSAALKGSAAEDDQLGAHLWKRSEELCSKFVGGYQAELGQ